ncbi:uncharacterized protein LOC113389777 [Ctenocephalides felis]|uniref:uncharacterized protein LOC113389777 n=1 Tax=Ctenocephalides felis TaxID=7515 RepID=UPI000E6E5370|nr:uncharacterized protein LOC113389777 [Ctenocephalides felis]
MITCTRLFNISSKCVLNRVVFSSIKNNLQKSLCQTTGFRKMANVQQSNVKPVIYCEKTGLLGDDPSQKKIKIDYRLPEGVKPVHYDLLLTPDLKTGKFSGHVGIDVQVKAKRNDLVLHGKDLRYINSKSVSRRMIVRRALRSGDGSFILDPHAEETQIWGFGDVDMDEQDIKDLILPDQKNRKKLVEI